MKLANGIDLLEIDRMHDAIATHGEHFMIRVFTARELEANAQKLESLAGQF